jgi:hypothetical protein
MAVDWEAARAAEVVSGPDPEKASSAEPAAVGESAVD